MTTGTRFERDTRVERIDDGSFTARMDRGWWISRGANGGYVAAVVLRALLERAGDPSRAPRAFTVHFTSPPAEGDVRIDTRIEREGRSLSTVSARMGQGDRLVAVALAALSRGREGPEFQDAVMPEAIPPERAEPLPSEGPPMRQRYESRRAFGREAGAATTGGWIRLREPQPLDAPLIAALCDSWPPAVFQKGIVHNGAPTAELTVHFRHPLPPARLAEDAFVLARFTSRVAREGFVEEDGELWTADGRLLAQSRQLAVLL
jgi:acyl-CoA thioesterase